MKATPKNRGKRAGKGGAKVPIKGDRSKRSTTKRIVAKKRRAEARPTLPARVAIRSERPVEVFKSKRLVATPSPLLSKYAQGVGALGRKEYERALELFGGVLAAPGAEPVLVDRARVHVEVCRRALEEAQEHHRSTTDLYTTAVFEKNRGELGRAGEIVRRLLKRSDDERIHHLAASIHALAGAWDEAIAHLERALSQNPTLIVQVRNDPDFVDLRESDGYRAFELAARHAGHRQPKRSRP